MQKRPSIAALLTDFGLNDHYAGVMKGVMLSICPSLRIIDISHGVEAQNVQQASYLLWASYRFLPEGAIIVCVVDPGVGGSRDIIAAKTKRHVFLSPRNGLLDLVLWQEAVKEVTVLQTDSPKTRSILPSSISSTFHGRDIFAPLAAHLALGARLGSLGPKTRVDWVKAPFVDHMNPQTQPRVLHVDRFGNIITNIAGGEGRAQHVIRGIQIGSTNVDRWIENYELAPRSIPCLIVGSSGLVEIVVKKRSAATYLSVDVNTSLKIL